MANTLYDKDADKEHAPSSQQGGQHDQIHDGEQGAYDQQFNDLAQAEYDNEFNGMVGGSPGSTGASTAADLNKAENDAAGDKDDKVGSGYQPEKKPKPAGNKAFWNKVRARNAGIAALIAALSGASLIEILTILSGPAHLINIAQGLSIFGDKGSSDNSHLIHDGLQFEKDRKLVEKTSGKGGEATDDQTAIDEAGDDLFEKPIAELSEEGVNIEDNGQTTIDVSEFKKDNPQLKGMSEDQIKNTLAEDVSTPDETISTDQITGSGNKLTLDLTEPTLGEAALIPNNGSNLSTITGETLEGEQVRSLSVDGVDFHPLTADEDEDDSGGTPAEQLDAENNEETDLTTEAEPVTAEADTAVAEIQSDSATDNSPTAKALLFTAGACFLRAIGKLIITVNRDRVVLPLIIFAFRLISTGSQIQAGSSDTSFTQLGAISSSLNNSSGQFESGQAYQAATTGTYDPNASDTPADLQQAFYTRSSVITAWTTAALGGALLANTLCSKAGEAAQALASIGIGAAAIISDAATDGALTPVDVAVWTLKQGIGFATTLVSMHFVQSYILRKAVPVLAESVLSGPEGGNLAANGARAGFNTAAAMGGGINLGNTNSTVYADAEINEQKQQFQSEDFIARVFDAYNSNSLLGRLALDVTPSFSQNLAMITGGLFNVGGIFQHEFADIFPKALAEPSYDWEYGQFGIPPQMLNDPNLKNPYTNGDDVAQLLDQTCLTGTTVNITCEPAQRIMDCFGNVLEYNNAMWNVKATSDVDPNSDTYAGGNCDDIGTPQDTAAGDAVGQWRRIIMFVASTHVLENADCYEGNQAACGNEGISM